jgi:putative flippase GtrA
VIYLTLKYALFAGIATLVNISTQYVSLRIYSSKYSLYLAMGAGTLTGLVVKYYLDKRYIFYYETENSREDLGKFILYSFMGLFTTLIFWASELSFHYLLDFQEAKYIGAATGLTTGYVTKYFLDRRFVFRKN